MTLLKLCMWSAFLFGSALLIEGYEWRCPLPRAKYYGSWQTDKIEAQGLIELDGTQVTKSLAVKGSLQAEGAKIACAYIEGRASFDKSCIDGDIKIIGSGFFKNSKIAGITRIGGHLEALCTSFCFGIETCASYVELRNSSAPRIYFGPGAENLQLVKLMQGSVIEGDIEFACGQGRVIIDRTSVLKGQVRGGMIIDSCHY